MAGSVNKVIVLGNLGRDVEMRYSAGGDAIANFSLAATETWKDKNGEKQERTEWVRCTAFGRVGEIASQYLKKGDRAYVEGRLQTRKYTDKDGVEKYSTEVVVNDLVLLGGGKREGGDGERPARKERYDEKAEKKRDLVDNTDQDDIPF